MSAGTRASRQPARNVIVPLCLVLVGLQVAFRAWASFGSWWEGDDFLIIARMSAHSSLDWSLLVQGYVGHLMPGVFFVTWAINSYSPYNWNLAAAFLVLMQALAGLGMVRLLVTAFGKRWGVVPPLVVYLCTSFSVQGAVWWAAGAQSLPLQVAMAWSVSSYLSYLRSGSRWALLFSWLWVVFGLLFFEKALFIIGILAILTLAYFSAGTLTERCSHVLRHHRLATVMFTLLGVAHLALYRIEAQSFSAATAAAVPIGPTLDTLILRSWATGALGGPLTWHVASRLELADPSPLLVVAAWVFLVLFVRTLASSRSRALRALTVLVFVLSSDLILLVAGRGMVFGSVVAAEFRYLGEIGLVTALTLALASMPLIGAPEPVERRASSWLLDHRVPATFCTIAVALLGSYSSQQYFQHWLAEQKTKTYVESVIHSLRTAPPGTQVADAPAPDFVLLPLAQPNNLVSVLARPLHTGVHFVAGGDESLQMLDTTGRLTPLTVPAIRRGVIPSGCVLRLDAGQQTIPLDGPAAFGGWWVAVDYLSTASTSVTLHAGGDARTTSLAAGLHTLFVPAGGELFDSITIGGIVAPAEACVSDVRIGRPTPAEN